MHSKLISLFHASYYPHILVQLLLYFQNVLFHNFKLSFFVFFNYIVPIFNMILVLVSDEISLQNVFHIKFFIKYQGLATDAEMSSNLIWFISWKLIQL